jgi:PBP1b-binding outer membrane lipoprotein LpoB
MKKLYRVLLIIFITLIINGCSTLYVTTTMSQGVQPHVKKEMIENDKRLRKEQRETNKIHRERQREINKAQQRPWK